MKIIAGLAVYAMLCPAHGEQVIGIADGDTITILQSGRPLKIRLAGIDAPEKKQAFGQRSKESLSNMCWQKNATYVGNEIDKYGRTIAVVYCDGVNANKAQLAKGMAWVYTKYNKDTSLIAIESEARSARLGLWQDTDPIPPWIFRRKK
jgi:micrococcal nuclease